MAGFCLINAIFLTFFFGWLFPPFLLPARTTIYTFITCIKRSPKLNFYPKLFRTAVIRTHDDLADPWLPFREFKLAPGKAKEKDTHLRISFCRTSKEKRDVV